MLDLDKLLECWVKCTGKEVKDFNKIRLGVESDWLCNKAIQMMSTDPTGVLTGITMRGAYRAFINDNTVTIKQLIDGEWDAERDNWKELYNHLYVENVGPIVDNVINGMVTTINNFGHSITREEIENEPIEKIFTDAFEKIKYFKKDTFKAIESEITCTPKICNKLHRFEHYQQFVDVLKADPSDNLIVVALIDRTAEIADCDYDEQYDKFFAFGIKHNDGIMVISDRTTFGSPETIYKSRNPGRHYYNKVDYSHLPYHILDKISAVTSYSNQLLLPSPDFKEEFCSEFDLEGYIYITAIIAIITDRYFKKHDSWESKISYFSTDIKFLPAAEVALLPVIADTIITQPENTVKASDYKGNDNIHNHGIFDFYIDRFPVTDVNALIPARTAVVVADKEYHESLAWWRVRKAQSVAIKEGLKKSYTRERRAWIHDLIKNSMAYKAEEFLEYAFTHPDNKAFDKYDMQHSKGYEHLPYFPDLYANWEELDTIQVKAYQHKSVGDYYKPSKYYNSDDRLYMSDNLVVDKSYNSVKAYFIDDSDNRSVDINIKLRSYSDLVKFLDFKDKYELPIELQHYLYTRTSYCTKMGWVPYTGNCILHFEDPMNEIEDPWNDECFEITFHMSKSKYNKLVKQYGNKRPKEVGEVSWMD